MNNEPYFSRLFSPNFSRPIPPLLFSFITGIIAGDKIPNQTLCWVFITVTIGYVIVRRVKGRSFSFSPLILSAALGYTVIQIWTSPNFPSYHVIHFTDTHPWEIYGTISSDPITKRMRKQFYLDIQTLSHNKEKFPVKGKIRVTVIGENADFAKGDEISFTSRIRSIRNFSNPGGFDYERYMAFQGVRGSAYVKGENVSIVTHREKKGWGGISLFRKNISRQIENCGSDESKHVLKALLIGDRAGVDPSLRDAFNRAGLGHLLAISGLHIGIVASFAFFTFQRLLSFIPLLLWQGWVKKTAALLSLIPICFYGFISGMSPSTQRAVIMVSIFLMTFLVEREQDLFNTLALAALVILIFFPPALFMISFQLSFSAVAAILFGMSRLPLKTEPDAPLTVKYGKRVLTFLAVSLFAILGTLPLVMKYFNQISLVGLLANCIGVPLVGFLVVPFGLISVFLSPISTSVSSLGFQLSSDILDQTINVIRFMASFDFAAVKTITPSVLEISCYYLFIWGICYVRKSHAAKILIGFVMLVLGMDMGYWVHRRYFNEDLRITAMDVGQGTANLLELPKGYTIMIDGGGFSDNTLFDVGERIIAPYLWRNKIRTVDTLILSHPNSDHLNGLIYIADNFHVKNVWSNNEPAKTYGYRDFMSVISKHNIRHPEFSTLPKTRTINGVELKFLNPPTDFKPNSIIAKMNGSNNNSMVVKATFGTTSFLFPGDITRKTERQLISNIPEDLPATILFSPHHGSKTSSSGPFLDCVTPEAVIISAGWNNRFHFPHPSVVKRYNQKGCNIFRTDLNGAVRILSDGKTFNIQPTIN